MFSRVPLALCACALMSVMSSLALAAEQPTARTAAAPSIKPPQCVIESAVVRAASKDGAMQGTLEVRIRGLARGETWLPLFSGKTGILSAEISGGGWGDHPMIMRQDGTIGVLLPDRGRYTAKIEFASVISDVRQSHMTTIPSVAALSGSCEITLDGQNLKIDVAPEMPFQTRTDDGKTAITVLGTVAGGLALTWEAAPEEREVETIAFAEQQMQLQISPGLVRVQSAISFNILQGGMKVAEVGLPDGYALLKVDCAGMRNWDLRAEDGGTKTLVVNLLEAATKPFQIDLTLEKSLGDVPAEFEAPQVAVRGVRREKGVIAVVVQKGLQSEILEKKNIGQINLAEMPPAMRALGEGLNLGLQYLARPFSVKFRVSEIQPKVYGQIACLTVASLERFRQYWDVQYEIRNAGLFQLKLRLPDGMKLISLRGENINNQSFDEETRVLTVDLRAKAEGSYGLSLQTSSGIADAEQAAMPAIELVGVERQWGTIALSTDAGISVEAVKATGISQIDLAEIKGMTEVQTMLKDQRATAPVLAFRYLTFPFTLTLAVSHISPELKVEPLHFVEITRKNLRYHSVFNYRIKKTGVFQVRLHLPAELRGNLQVEGDKVEDYSYDAASQTLTVQLTEKVEDALTLDVKTEALLGKELPRPGESGTLPIPAVYALDCEQERGYIVLGTQESIRLKRAGDGGTLHDVDVQEIAPALLQRAKDPKLAFRVIESGWSLNVEATSIPPKITAQAFNYVRFGEDYLIGASTLDFDIQHAGVKEFFVRLPAGVKEPNILGANIKIQEKIQEDTPTQTGGDLWHIELQSEVKNSYQLIFEYTTDLDPKEKLRKFSGPRVMGEMKEVEREIGYLAVTGDPSLELTPVEGELKALTPIDEEEIPLKFRQLPRSVAQQIGRSTVPILFAFRYLAHPYTLALDSVRHDEADVVTAVIESCMLDTTVTREGNRITSFVASVRSRYQPFLEIELPRGAELHHALVNGRRVRPLSETRDGADITKVPIAQVQGILGPVQVELQWEEMGGHELGRWQDIGLTVPSLMGVRILRLGWVLQLPRRYRVVSAGGTLEKLDGPFAFEESLRNLQPSLGEPVQAMTEQGNASPTDFQWEVNAGVLTGRSGAKQMGRSTPLDSATKPEMPVRCYFQGLILNPQATSDASVLCLKAPALTLSVAVVIIVLLAGCAALWFGSGLAGRLNFAILAAAALLATGLMIVMEGDYTPYFYAAIGTIGGCALIFSGVWLTRCAHRGRPAQ